MTASAMKSFNWRAAAGLAAAAVGLYLVAGRLATVGPAQPLLPMLPLLPLLPLLAFAVGPLSMLLTRLTVRAMGNGQEAEHPLRRQAAAGVEA